MFIDIHVLQSVPPSNINRDDTGSPKTAIFGGTRRARVSSQAWKRATRTRFNLTLDKSNIGFRTKRLAELLGDQIGSKVDGLSSDDAYSLASKTFASAGIKMTAPKVAKGSPKEPDESGYLVFLSAGQLEALADAAVEAHLAGEVPDKKAVKAIINSDNSIDVALFGRMIADDAELNVDAAVQVAHALSVQAVEQEFDYFTAVDDFGAAKNETGAGMIGTIEFNSSTLYRYATINVAGLHANLGDTTATAEAAAAFVESFSLSMPTGKQNTFANNTLPDVVLICVRSDQPVNLVGAFEDAIVPTLDAGAVLLASRQLAQREKEIAEAYGPPDDKFYTAVGAAVVPLEDAGARFSMADLVQRVKSIVDAELSTHA